MNTVLTLPASITFTPDQALDSAKQACLIDVLIAGYKPDGELYVRSSRMTRSDALWLAEKLKAWALNDN